MKSLFCFILLTGFAASLYAQDCQGFVPATVNTSLEYNHLNAKGKIESSHKSVLKEIVQNADALIFKTQNTYFDDKGKELSKSDFEYICKDGVISFNLSNMFDQSMLSQYQTMEMKVESDKMEIPSVLQAGQTLNDGTATITILNQGVKMMTMNMAVTNRKVEAIENITVAAGTFPCYKITYDVETKVMFKVQVKAVDWYSMNIGLVKSETYDKNGKLTGSTELKSYSK
jgi:hypothetical protein